MGEEPHLLDGILGDKTLHLLGSIVATLLKATKTDTWVP
jgi:hypothetical protein